jgi:hypothetical protein
MAVLYAFSLAMGLPSPLVVVFKWCLPYGKRDRLAAIGVPGQSGGGLFCRSLAVAVGGA